MLTAKEGAVTRAPRREEQTPWTPQHGFPLVVLDAGEGPQLWPWHKAPGVVAEGVVRQQGVEDCLHSMTSSNALSSDRLSARNLLEKALLPSLRYPRAVASASSWWQLSPFKQRELKALILDAQDLERSKL